MVGADVFRHAGTIDWGQAVSNRVHCGWAMATEGLDFVDDQFDRNGHHAKNNGIYIGAYRSAGRTRRQHRPGQAR
jgi:GH25 family lysozyme M1 (1,4-beta-N-acetylmuramidase)